MIHLFLADDLPLSVLGMVVEPVVVYDPTGTKVIGHYTPVDLERGRRLYAEAAARIDPAEIERQINANEPQRPIFRPWQRPDALGENGTASEVPPKPTDVPESKE